MSKIETQEAWDLFGDHESIGHNAVYYDNKIARMPTAFNLEEEKLLHMVFSKLNSFEKNNSTVTLSKKELFENLNISGNSKYQRYKKIFKGIINKSYVEISDENAAIFGSVIRLVKWNYSGDKIEVKLTEEFMPYISELVDNFTMVRLEIVMKFKSKYTLSIYRWLCSWADNRIDFSENGRYITTKELKELCGLKEEDYVYNGKFNRSLFEKYVIDVAISEINFKTDMRVEYKKNKESNKVKTYAFHFVRSKNKEDSLYESTHTTDKPTSV